MPRFTSELFASILPESITSAHPSLDDISRASSLSTSASFHHTDSSTPVTPDHSPHQVGGGSQPRISTPSHPIDPPRFSPSPQADSKNDTGNSSNLAAPLKLSKSLRTLVINFQSLRPKKAELLHLLTATNPDIIIGTETWLKPEITNAELFPPDFNVFRNDRSDGYGGSLVATKSNMIAHQVSHGTKSDAVLVKIEVEGKRTRPIIVGSVYRTPSETSKEQIEEICTCLRTLKPKDTLWIGGDTNVPDIDWRTLRVEGHQYPEYINRALIECT